jgi:DnaK suppressor protein
MARSPLTGAHDLARLPHASNDAIPMKEPQPVNSAPKARVDDQLRSELIEALTQRLETLTRQHDQLSVELDEATDDNDLGIDATQVIRGNLEQVAAAMRDAERALARVRHDDFGSCESCGAAIPMERLRALPDTTRCAACASVP